MDDEFKVLRFNWRGKIVDIRVEIDKCTLLDVVMDYEAKGKEEGVKLDYHFPTFYYRYKDDQFQLVVDKDMMTMFKRCAEKALIPIAVGTTIKPSPIHKLVLNLRRSNEAKHPPAAAIDNVVENVQENDVGLEDLEDNSVATVRQEPKQKQKAKKKAMPKQKGKAKIRGQSSVNLPPDPISPKTAFQSLPVRRSPRFSPTLMVPTAKTSSFSDQGTFKKKVPRTTAVRKGQGSVQGESSTSQVRRRVDFPSEDDEAKDSDDEVMASDNLPSDEEEDIGGIPKFKDNFKPGKWHDFIDEDDDSNYYQALYRNGELFEDKKFGSIKLRAWMIFMDKKHFKDTLKDYAIQEGFAINVLAADNKRYTGTCYAENCGWRIHASRLPDEKTWAIKKIEPSVHTCRGLETYNPLCDVKWASAKLMEDIRANPDIPGKTLNELLFQRLCTNEHSTFIGTMFVKIRIKVKILSD